MVIFLTGFFFFYGCSKDKEESTGQVVFWNDTSSDLGIVTVVMEDATSGNITLNYGLAPKCDDAAGCFVYSNSPGDYSYVAIEEDGNEDGEPDHTWEGVITITSGGCLRTRLYANE
jgi:hypothetical protein